MHAGSTLFLDVCVQRDFWPGGAWAIVRDEDARHVAELFALAAELSVRQGGVVCMHGPTPGAAPPAGPPHCADAAGMARPPGYLPARPAALYDPDTPLADLSVLDRTHAIYVASGCAIAPDASPAGRRLFDHLTAGVRDAVVFGAGIEHAVDRAVDALLRRRIRTHVVLDAAAPADPAEAQRVVAEWKRRTVDGLTGATVRRMLVRGTPGRS